MFLKQYKGKRKGLHRRLKFMPTLDRYIFIEFTIAFICCILAFEVLFLTGDLLNTLHDFLEEGSSFFTIISYFALKQPANITFVLPISLLLSSMYTLARLGMNNEITAMRASGISLFRCAGGMYIVGLIVTGVNFWFNESLAPMAMHKAEVIKSVATNPYYIPEDKQLLVYVSPNGKRVWLLNDLSMTGVNKVEVKKSNAKGKLLYDMNAQRAYYTEKSGWTFYNATVKEYQNVILHKDIQGLTGTETVSRPVITHYKEFDSQDKLFKMLVNNDESPSTIRNSLRVASDMSMYDIIDYLITSKGVSQTTLNIYYTELYAKIAFPWICLLAVFLGVPLAASHERSGVMKSVISAVVIIVVYMVIKQTFMSLGQRGVLPAIIAGFLPTLALAAYVIQCVIRQK